MHEIKELVGQTIKKSSLYPKSGDDVLDIVTENFRYRLYHDQDCCESVEIERVLGVEYLFGKVLEVEETYPDIPCDQESYTWTNYKFVTENGTCEILWLGYSNGYYNESVSLDRTNLAGFELIQPVLTDEFQPTETDHNPTHTLDRIDVCSKIGQFFLDYNNGDYKKTETQILKLLLKDISISGPDSICIELARPGLLIGMRGKTVIALQEYLGLKILVKESESINSLVIPVDAIYF